MSEEEFDIEKLLEDHFDLRMKDVHTTLPVIVESVDLVAQTVALKIAIKTKFKGDDDAREFPTVHDAPILTLRTGLGMQLCPVAVGDVGTAFFASRSIEDYMEGNGTPTYPESSRQFDLSDAYFLPAGYPLGKPWMLALPNNAMGYSLGPTTKLWFGGDANVPLTLNGGKDDVINILYALIQIVTVIDATPDPSGVNAAKLTELLTALAPRKV